MADKVFSLLIADDEEKILRGMEKYIQAHTTCFDRIYCASNGQEAQNLIYRYHPDVMLVDIQMPLRSGLDVMREAINAGVCPQTVVLSGFETFSYAQQALRMGARDYLLKPCRSSELLEKLESLVRDIAPKAPDARLEGNPTLQAAARYIQEHLDGSLSLTEVAQVVAVSPAYLSQIFSQAVGGFVEYINQRRIELACEYMRDPTLRVYEIALRVGFRDEKYFSKVFKQVMGMSPSEYRKTGGAGEDK